MKYSDYKKIKWFDEFVKVCLIDLNRVPEYHDNPILEYLELINDCRWVNNQEIKLLKRELKIFKKKLEHSNCELKYNFAIVQLEKLKNKLNEGTQLVDIYVFGVIDKQILDLTFKGEKKNVKQSNK